MRASMRGQHFSVNGFYSCDRQVLDWFTQARRLKRAEFFLINRFAAAAAVLGVMVGRTGVKTIDPPS